MKAAIIIGHDNKNQGAKSYNNITEYQYNLFIGLMIDKLHSYKEKYLINSINKLKVFDRNNGWPNVIKNIKDFNPDVTIELHFNSFPKEVRGVETLCLKDDYISKKFAQLLSSRIAEKYRSKLRHKTGVLEVKEGSRGYNNLKVIKGAGCPVTVLVEPAFMNHMSFESVELTRKPLGYAELIYNSLEDWAVMQGDLDAIF